MPSAIKNTPSILLFELNQNGETNNYLRMVLGADNCVTSGMVNKSNVYIEWCVATTYKRDFLLVKNIDTTHGMNKKHIPKFKGPHKVKLV